jgi:Helicase associated domain
MDTTKGTTESGNDPKSVITESATNTVKTKDDDGIVIMNPRGKEEEEEFATWEDFLEELKFHKEHHPKQNVPFQFLEWVYEQRVLWRNGKLENDKYQKLEELGLQWDDGPIDKVMWEMKFNELVAYQQRQFSKSNSTVGKGKEDDDDDDDQGFPPEEEQELAEWFDAQLQLFQKGDLSFEQEQKLDSLGFDLTNHCVPKLKLKNEDNSDSSDLVANLRTASVEALQREKKVPANRSPNTRSANRRAAVKASTKLHSHTVATARKQNRSPTKKTPPVASALNTKKSASVKSPKQQSHGTGGKTNKNAIVLFGRECRSWEQSFELWKNYKKEHGHSTVPMSYDSALAYWVRTQRKERNTMPQERRQILEQAGMDLFPMTTKPNEKKTISVSGRECRNWEQSFELWKKYKEEHPDSSNPFRHHHDTALAHWVQTQRKERNTMPQERRQRLEQAGMDLSPMTKKWNETFQALVEKGKLVQDISLTPQQFDRLYLTSSKDRNLESFFRRQRQLLSEGKLTQEQETKLNDFLESLQDGTKEFTLIINNKRTTNKRSADEMNGATTNKRSADEMNGASLEVKRAPKRDWNENYAALVAFKKKHGHCCVPKRCAEDTVLGSWVSIEEWSVRLAPRCCRLRC